MKVKNQQSVAPPEYVKPKVQQRWIGSWIILAACSFIAYGITKANVPDLSTHVQQWLQKAFMVAGIAFVVLGISRFIEGYSSKHAHSKAAQYNLVRMIRLLTAVLIIFLIVTFFFTHWYAAAVSLGLFSLILGFALQTPISSFIGWLYIILRNPYQVGDRIQLDTFKGDVVEIGYLDTTIWEFGGDYLTSDLPTGRLIRFPNSMVFSAPVFNYSWKKFPYIWNELPFHIAYESDFDFVTKTLREQATRILGNAMEEQVKHLKEMIGTSAIDKVNIKEYPFVTLRTNANTWVEATLVYLVPPRESSDVRTQIMQAAVAALKQSPEKVLFPNGNNR